MLHAVGVNRAFRPYKSKQGRLSRSELRSRCEAARLDLRALFRSLDRRKLLLEIPAELRILMELDADLAEALWVLDQPKGRFDLHAMERDTLASIERIPAARDRVLALVGAEDREDLLSCVTLVRADLAPEDAYAEIPGRDPLAS